MTLLSLCGCYFKKWLIISLFLLVGCSSEDISPLEPIEHYEAEVDLSQLEYVYSLEQVVIEQNYEVAKNTSIQDLIDDRKYIKLVYGEVETFTSEEDLLMYLEKQLNNYDKRIAIIYDSKSVPALGRLNRNINS